jgi:hypothetical protein
MTPNSDLPLLDENQDIAEDYEEPRPQDDGPSLPATSSSSSSSFPKIFVKHSALEDLISLVDDSLPFTPDSADLSHDDIRLLDPTQQDGYRLRGDQHFPRASRAREVRHQPRRRPANEPEDRGRMLELRLGPPVSPYMTLSPEDRHRQLVFENEYRRQQYQRGVLWFVHERQLTVHGQSIPGGFSRRVTAYAASAEATEVFRRENPPPPENAYYISSSEDDDCKYADPMLERTPDDGDDKEAWLQRQEARREELASEAVEGRHAGKFVPVYTRLAEIENTVENRLRETAEVSPWFGAGLHLWSPRPCYVWQELGR